MMMKIAILSDIHGNIVALEAVLKDMQLEGNFDYILVPGDFFAFGPAPNEVFTVLSNLPNTLFLMGNTDRYLLEKTYPSSVGGNGWQEKLLLSFRWTADHLAPGAYRLLETLPATQLIQDGDRQLLAVHGSPRSDEEGLTAKTDHKQFQEMSIAPEVSVLVCGHTHIPMDRVINGVRVINAGSVGLPFDRDPRACYAIISNLAGNGSGSTQVELRRVVYDIDQAIDQFYNRHHPAADISAYNLWAGRSIGSSLIYTAEMRHHHFNN
ncbi:MAG: metallophosphoesterase family protein [Chloroflexota bacterium]